ncbi:MAG: hypothetical protein GY940_42905, partial [bacterium]|nr:hypothetical protein [bacterium]
NTRGIVESSGDIAWRGSIVDVFPIDNPWPVRIEVEADIVVSIRLFDPDTQKSLKRITSVAFPISRYFLNYENCTGYFNGPKDRMHYLTSLLGNYRVVVSDKLKVTDEFGKLMGHYKQIHEMLPGPDDIQDETSGELTDDTPVDDTPEKTAVLLPPEEMFTFPFEKETVISINETWDDISAPVQWVKLQKSIAEFNLDDIHALRDKVDAM